MKLSIEIDNVHDLILLETILDTIKKDDESDDCEADDDGSCKCAEEEMPEGAKAAKEELDRLADVLRRNGIADVRFEYCGTVHRSKDRK